MSNKEVELRAAQQFKCKIPCGKKWIQGEHFYGRRDTNGDFNGPNKVNDGTCG